MLRLLLDENLPKKLKYRFGDDFEVITVLDMPDLQFETDLTFVPTIKALFEQNQEKYCNWVGL